MNTIYSTIGIDFAETWKADLRITELFQAQINDLDPVPNFPSWRMFVRQRTMLINALRAVRTRF